MRYRDLLDANGDLAIVQQLAGHASPATPTSYDWRPEKYEVSVQEQYVVVSL